MGASILDREQWVTLTASFRNHHGVVMSEALTPWDEKAAVGASRARGGRERAVRVSRVSGAGRRGPRERTRQGGAAGTKSPRVF